MRGDGRCGRNGNMRVEMGQVMMAIVVVVMGARSVFAARIVRIFAIGVVATEGGVAMPRRAL